MVHFGFRGFGEGRRHGFGAQGFDSPSLAKELSKIWGFLYHNVLHQNLGSLAWASDPHSTENKDSNAPSAAPRLGRT